MSPLKVYGIELLINNRIVFSQKEKKYTVYRAIKSIYSIALLAETFRYHEYVYVSQRSDIIILLN